MKFFARIWHFQAARRAHAVVAPLLLLAAPGIAAELKVAASIQPLHSLVAGVMQGVAEPRLIVPGRASPHGYQMRPSEAGALYAADLVFWMGVPLENFLQEALRNVRSSARIVTLLDTPGLELLGNRRGGAWDTEHAAGHDHGGLPSAIDDRARDPHVWLSPRNAKRLVDHMANVLAEVDPGNASRYRNNAATLRIRIDTTASNLGSALAPVRTVPFIMFHDAFQYFEFAFELSAAGALHLEPDRAPGAKRLQELRAAIRARGVRCVFREPQFQSALVTTLVEGTDTRVGVVDPLGAGFPPGPDAWFRMMETNAEAMVGCLGTQ